MLAAEVWRNFVALIWHIFRGIKAVKNTNRCCSGPGRPGVVAKTEQTFRLLSKIERPVTIDVGWLPRIGLNKVKTSSFLEKQ